ASTVELDPARIPTARTTKAAAGKGVYSGAFNLPLVICQKAQQIVCGHNARKTTILINHREATKTPLENPFCGFPNRRVERGHSGIAGHYFADERLFLQYGIALDSHLTPLEHTRGKSKQISLAYEAYELSAVHDRKMSKSVPIKICSNACEAVF